MNLTRQPSLIDDLGIQLVLVGAIFALGCWIFLIVLLARLQPVDPVALINVLASKKGLKSSGKGLPTGSKHVAVPGSDKIKTKDHAGNLYIELDGGPE